MTVTREILDIHEKDSGYIVSGNGNVYKINKDKPKSDKSLIIHTPVIEVHEADLENLKYCCTGWFVNKKDNYSFQFVNLEAVY